jgi:hypothetical protein
MTLRVRPAGTSDIPLLAALNEELIHDQRHSVRPRGHESWTGKIVCPISGDELDPLHVLEVVAQSSELRNRVGLIGGEGDDLGR